MRRLLFALSALLAACAGRPSLIQNSLSVGTPPPPVAELPGDEDRYDSLREQGFAHYSRGDFDRAITQWEAAFLADPQAGELWPRFLLHYCYLATGEYSPALTLAEELVKLAPYDPLAYQQLGLSQLWLGQTAQALQSFQRALDFDSHSPRVHFYQALAQERLKKPAQRDRSFAEAEKEYRTILEKNPDDFAANYELAALYLFQNKQAEDAARLLARARSLAATHDEPELTEDRKNFVNYYLALQEGILLSRKGEHQASTDALYRSLRQAPAGTKPDLAEIYFYLGKNRLARGEPEGARALLEKSLRMDANGPYAAEARALSRARVSRESTEP